MTSHLAAHGAVNYERKASAILECAVIHLYRGQLRTREASEACVGGPLTSPPSIPAAVVIVIGDLIIAAGAIFVATRFGDPVVYVLVAPVVVVCAVSAVVQIAVVVRHQRRER